VSYRLHLSGLDFPAFFTGWCIDYLFWWTNLLPKRYNYKWMCI